MDEDYKKPKLYPDNNKFTVHAHWENKGRELVTKLLEPLPPSRKSKVSKAILQFIERREPLPENLVKDEVAQKACRVYALYEDIGVWIMDTMGSNYLAYERRDIKKAMESAKLLEEELRKLEEPYFEVMQVKKDLERHYLKLDSYGRWNVFVVFIVSSLCFLYT